MIAKYCTGNSHGKSKLSKYLNKIERKTDRQTERERQRETEREHHYEENIIMKITFNTNQRDNLLIDAIAGLAISGWDG
jgi:hypothetical protein